MNCKINVYTIYRFTEEPYSKDDKPCFFSYEEAKRYGVEVMLMEEERLLENTDVGEVGGWCIVKQSLYDFVCRIATCEANEQCMEVEILLEYKLNCIFEKATLLIDTFEKNAIDKDQEQIKLLRDLINLFSQY